MTGAQCAECRVWGGKGEPCVEEWMLAAIRRDNGRACPRVFLDADNALITPLIAFLVAEHLRPAFGFAVEARLGGLPPDEQRVLLERLVFLMRTRPVLEAMYPHLKDKR